MRRGDLHDGEDAGRVNPGAAALDAPLAPFAAGPRHGATEGASAVVLQRTASLGGTNKKMKQSLEFTTAVFKNGALRGSNTGSLRVERPTAARALTRKAAEHFAQCACRYRESSQQPKGKL
jgi:hypothetical protein